MNRRTFLSLFGSVSTATLLTSATGRAFAMAHSDAWPGYRQAIVIDSLGGPGTAFSEGLTPLSPDELHDVRASGLTAVNLTVNGSPGSYARDYDETVRQIAYWNAEIAAHANIFLQVLRAVDIAEAKRSGRLGIIYGFQDATPIAEDLNRVDTFRNLGVRIFQLTYNRRNLVG
ncbi:MAG TPA: membrane dipeptidase, partial [Acidobacteriaceae bacterium]